MHRVVDRPALAVRAAHAPVAAVGVALEHEAALARSDQQHRQRHRSHLPSRSLPGVDRGRSQNSSVAASGSSASLVVVARRGAGRGRRSGRARSGASRRARRAIRVEAAAGLPEPAATALGDPRFGLAEAPAEVAQPDLVRGARGDEGRLVWASMARRVEACWRSRTGIDGHGLRDRRASDRPIRGDQQPPPRWASAGVATLSAVARLTERRGQAAGSRPMRALASASTGAAIARAREAPSAISRSSSAVSAISAAWRSRIGARCSMTASATSILRCP